MIADSRQREPILEIVGDDQLSDEAIDALASLLLDDSSSEDMGSDVDSRKDNGRDALPLHTPE